jgi:hypothetical protein
MCDNAIHYLSSEDYKITRYVIRVIASRLLDLLDIYQLTSNQVLGKRYLFTRDQCLPEVRHQLVFIPKKPLSVTGRFKTSHLWALLKTSHDVMGFVSLTRLYSDCRPGQWAGLSRLSFSSLSTGNRERLAGSRGRQ